ncbi:MAG: hypothetical protein E4H01_13460 [Lysobacterales bacterium]|nr:MAG: hypothetical protein E4H01_13460 [Xanthomonadales bacterium]
MSYRDDGRAGSRPGDIRRTAANDKFHNFKACLGCGETKRLADFAKTNGWRNKRAADPKRYKPRCKACTKAYNAARVDPNFEPRRTPRVPGRDLSPAEKRAIAAEYKRQARRLTRIKALEYLADKGCESCGERDPRVLEFDHIEPGTKNGHVADLFGNGYSWGSERLREEIRKCRVLCANCHRRHTIVQQDHYSHPDVRDALQGIYATYGITDG